MVTRKELIKIAHSCRVQTGEPDRKWPPAEHYFDKVENQIAMVYNPQTSKEHIIVFEPPRTWPDDLKALYTRTVLRKT